MCLNNSWIVKTKSCWPDTSSRQPSWKDKNILPYRYLFTTKANLLNTISSKLDIVFLSLRFFGRYVLRPSSCVCRTREPSRDFELRPLLKQVQVLSIRVWEIYSSEDWTCNLQIIVFLEAQGTNAYNRYAMCPAGQFRVNFWVL